MGKVLKIALVLGVGAFLIYAFAPTSPNNLLWPNCYGHAYDAEKCVRLEAIAAGWDPDAAVKFNRSQR
jgi:hypothetical protein